MAADLGFGILAPAATGDPNPLIREATRASKLVEVPSTSFEIDDALTKIKVTVVVGKFLMAPTEMTQQEFDAVTGYNPSFHQGLDLPVENVSWWEAIRCCNLLSIRDALQPCYNLENGFVI